MEDLNTPTLINGKWLCFYMCVKLTSTDQVSTQSISEVVEHTVSIFLKMEETTLLHNKARGRTHAHRILMT